MGQGVSKKKTIAPAGSSGINGATQTALNAKVNKSGDSMTGALNEAKGADIPSAATTDIGAATGNYIHVTGTTTITALGTIQAGAERTVEFDGILTITHNATSLILPGAQNILTSAGDVAIFRSEGSGNWRCVSYTINSGAYIDYSPTYTGFSVPPTVNAGDARYRMIGYKTCHVIVQTGGGTSNATTTTITLPFSAVGQQTYMVDSLDAGTHFNGSLRTRASSAIADCYKTTVGSTWTNSGNKVSVFSIVYQIE